MPPRAHRIVFSILSAFIVFTIFYGYNYTSTNADWRKNDENKNDLKKNGKDVLSIACVTCGQRVPDTLTMIKSALLFNQAKQFLRFLIFTEDALMLSFQEKLEDWKSLLPNEFEFEILPLQFPSNEWRNLFKPCASQRLFLPSILKSLDALIYVDTDTLFLSPVSDVWSYFNQFNGSQLAALTPEHEDEGAGWYNRFARHPYYGLLGVNSGVMLMNLTRMRDFDWESRIEPIFAEYKLRITWGDQDIINIFFYYHPEKLYIMPCQYNYRPDHCMYMSVCNVTSGIKIMHGNRGYFQSKKQLLFRTIYEAVENFQIGSNPYSDFLLPLEAALKEPSVYESNCGAVSKSSIKVATQIFHNENS